MVAALAGVAGLTWFVVIATMTQIGFSGNNRYLVLGSALVEICGAVAWGWAALEVGTLLAGGLEARTPDGSGGRPRRRRRAAGVAIVALAFVMLPSWVGNNLISIPRTHGSLAYQAHLRQGVTRLVAQYGAAKMLRCGTRDDRGLPGADGRVDARRAHGPDRGSAGAARRAGPAPNVILQTRDTRHASLLPTRPHMAVDALHLRRHERPVQAVHALPGRDPR